MIDHAVKHIAGQLNQFLKNAFDLHEDIVVISNLLEQDGSVASHVNNKLVLFLMNIEKDTTPYRQPNGNRSTPDRAVVSNVPLYLNLYLMFAGHFTGKNYPEALKFISSTIDFFQRNPVFSHENSPNLHARIEKLILDIENLDLRDLHSLWGILSSRYLPSILYKVRMVTFGYEDVIDQLPVITRPQASLDR